MEMTPVQEVRQIIKSASYEEIKQILEIATEEKRIFDAQRQEKAWLAVRDAIKAYTKEYGCITVNLFDGDTFAIENNSDFGTFGEIDTPEW